MVARQSLIFLFISLFYLKASFQQTALIILLIIYFTASELSGSLLILYADTEIQRNSFGFTIPSAALTTINPLLIIVSGPILSKFTLALKTRIVFSFTLISAAFVILYTSTLLSQPPIIYLIIPFSLIALGELLLAQAIFTFFSKTGMSIGLVTLSFSLANLLSVHLANFHLSKSALFLTITLTTASLALIFAFFFKRRASHFCFQKSHDS